MEESQYQKLCHLSSLAPYRLVDLRFILTFINIVLISDLNLRAGCSFFSEHFWGDSSFPSWCFAGG